MDIGIREVIEVPEEKANSARKSASDEMSMIAERLDDLIVPWGNHRRARQLRRLRRVMPLLQRSADAIRFRVCGPVQEESFVVR